MSLSAFLKQLTLISLLSAIGLYFVHQIPILAPHSALSWGSLGFFVALSLVMFFVGRKAAVSQNKNDFTNVFLLFLMAKLFSCAILVIVYLKTVEPQTKLFVLPFFGLYIIYTVFEVYFLSKLGRMQAA